MSPLWLPSSLFNSFEHRDEEYIILVISSSSLGLGSESPLLKWATCSTFNRYWPIYVGGVMMARHSLWLSFILISNGQCSVDLFYSCKFSTPSWFSQLAFQFWIHIIYSACISTWKYSIHVISTQTSFHHFVLHWYVHGNFPLDQFYFITKNMSIIKIRL